MTTNKTSGIGGYFELDLADLETIHPQALGFQSARSGFRAILEASEFEEIWMPNYLCDSMFESARLAEVRVQTYRLDSDLLPLDLPLTIPPNAAVLYVNYFGLNSGAAVALTQRLAADQLIIDNSQALFTPPSSALATIYSPRKFVGLPDGGLVAASESLHLCMPEVEDTESIERLRHLMIRAAYSAQEGYPHFQAARVSLSGQRPLAISALTKRLMRSVRWEEVRRIRRRNFDVMAAILGGDNAMELHLDTVEAPLCYPWMLQDHPVGSVVDELASRSVFVPRYWPDALPRIKPDSIEQQLLHNTLFLPIDQRMDLAQIEMVGELARKLALGR